MNSKNIAATILITGISILACSQAAAFDEEMYAISAVPRSEAKTLILGLNHAFLTKVIEKSEFAKDLPEKNFGTKGANVAVTAQWIPIEGIAVRALAGSRQSNGQLGISGNYSINYLAADIGSNFVIHMDGEKYRKSFLPFASVGSPLLFKEYNTDISLNVAYDSYNNLVGTGVGLAYNFGREHRIMAEYFPRISSINERKTEQGKKVAFDFGYRYHSFGHQYFLLLTNSSPVDLRQAILGSDSNDLGIAIRVNREM